jgi:hypothetical protein
MARPGLRYWTTARAGGAGSIAGLAALLLWPAYAAFPRTMILPFVAALLVACLCGASILWIISLDVTRHVRGSRLRVIRIFDILLGLVLAVPTFLELREIMPYVIG